MNVRLLALLPMAALALAQSAASPKPPAVEGKVVNSLTNEPLRKVELQLTTALVDEEAMQAAMAMFSGADAGPAPPPGRKGEMKTFKATTDANGKFQFASVDPGDYYLKASHAGFLDETYKPGITQGSEGKLHLSAGDQLAGIVLRLTPQGAISGRVVDEDGDPVPNAIVQAVSYHYNFGHRSLGPADSVTSNDRGEYRLGTLPPGHYYVSANSMQLEFRGTAAAPKDGTPETGYVTTYYPHTTDVSLASRVDVAAGADITGLTVQLQKSKVVRIKGHAVNADGTPMKSGQVILMNAPNMGSMRTASLDAEGRFELANVQPGIYTLVSVQVSGSIPAMTMQPVMVPADGLSNVKLGAQDDKSVEGRIVVAGDAKVDFKGIHIMLEAADSLPVMPAAATAGETGAFAVKVGAAPYQLVLPMLPQGAYLKAVTMGGRDAFGKPLDFSSGSGEVVITLAADGGQVDASVTLGEKPLFDATVVLLPADADRRFAEATRNSSTDEAGKVTIKDVPPGDYLVFAWEKIEDGEWFDPDVIKAVEKRAVRLTVGPKGTEKVELKAIPRA